MFRIRKCIKEIKQKIPISLVFAFERAVFAVVKIMLYVFGALILFMAVYFFLHYLIGGFDKAKEIYKGLRQAGLMSMFVIDSASYNNEKVSIFIAVFTIYITLLTILQQHINRRQDRVLSFPKMIVEKCCFTTDINSIRVKTSRYFYPGAKSLIVFQLKEAFSAYYHPTIYRCWIVKRPFRQGEAEIERINVLSSYSHLNGDSQRLEMAAGKTEILEDFCRRPHKYDYSVELVFDMRWTNMLMPFGLRKMSSMYLRNSCIVENEKEKLERFEHTYKVDNFEVKGAPFFEKRESI